MDVPPSVLRTMRDAARNVVLVRHTYNLVDMPIKVAGKSGTAEFGQRDEQGRLPYHSWFVGFVPKDPYHGNFDATTSKLVVLAFAYDSRTVGNAATEIVKYFCSCTSTSRRTTVTSTCSSAATSTRQLTMAMRVRPASAASRRADGRDPRASRRA